MAVMVSHSRLLLHIHTMKEVLLGAATGTAITLGIMIIFKALS
jgi:diacylglycerol kinase (ATP)